MSNTERRITPVFSGFHSITELDYGLDVGSHPILRKSYGEKAGGFSLAQATFLREKMHRYIGIARQIGLNVAIPIELEITPNGRPEKYNLVETVPFAGPNLQQTLQDGFSWGLIEDYLSMHRQVHLAGSPISLDPPMTNFCVHPAAGLIYVDFMPPRLQDTDGAITEWPPPEPENQAFIHERYFGPMKSRVIYAQGLRSLAQISSLSQDELFHRAQQFKQGILDSLGNEAFAQINIDEETARFIIENPQPTDVDLIRILAAERHCAGLLTKARMNEVYSACHIGIGGKLPTEEELHIAVQLLTQTI